MKKYKKNIVWTIASLFLAITILQSCEGKFEPLGEGSKIDETPPVASFSYTQGTGTEDEWKDYTFANTSKSATTYAWDFGVTTITTDTLTTEKDGKYTYLGEGTYTVTLMASDRLGVVSTKTQEIVVVEPPRPVAIIPTILEAGFEDDDLSDGTGDGRDSWRLTDAEIMQITSSPVQEGDQASKFPSAGDRNAYQELVLTANTDYVLTYYYTIKTTPEGSITVAVVDVTPGTATDLAEVQAKTALASDVGSNQTSANDYVMVDLPFNSGANTTVAIFISNTGAEARIDNFSIALATP